MKIRYKRLLLPEGFELPSTFADLWLDSMCSRIDLPSQIEYLDYTTTWALAK